MEQVPVREKIIREFVEQSQLLTSAVVQRCLRSEIERNILFVTVWDSNESIQNLFYNYEERQFDIVVEAQWVSIEHSIEANHLMAEMYETMMRREYFGVDKVSWQATYPGYPEDGQQVTTLRMVFRVGYKMLIGDPYTFFEE